MVDLDKYRCQITSGDEDQSTFFDFVVEAPSLEQAMGIIFDEIEAESEMAQEPIQCGSQLGPLFCTRVRGHQSKHWDDMRYDRVVSWR